MKLDGWVCECHDIVASTNDLAIARAEAGEAGRIAIIAARQTKARGSRGRVWTEPPSGNLALSVMLRPELRAADLGRVVLMAGLAFIEALDPHRAPGTRLLLKWPNDVMAGDGSGVDESLGEKPGEKPGGKLGGILVETAVADGRARWVVIGFGANLAAAPDLAGEERGVACLAADGAAPIGPEIVGEAVLRGLDRWMGAAFPAIRSAWLARAHPVGTMLMVDGNLRRFAGIADDGALLSSV